MSTITKKIWPEFFEAVASGKKTFELRLNDFDINEGDTIVLQEWDPKTQEYTGRSIKKSVGSVVRFKPNELPFWSPEKVEEHGLQVISLL